METFDVCVLVFTGLTTGMSIGLAIRNKQIKNLRDEIDAGDRSYMNLLDRYMELFSEHRNLKFATKARVKTEIGRKSPGRPKGSKNKPKQDGKPVTRKYTRKSSK